MATRRKNPTSLNTVTLKNAPFDKKLELAAEAGFDQVGLWFSDIDAYCTEGRTLTDLRRKLSLLGLGVAEICFLGGWQLVADEQRKCAFAQARQRFEQATELKANCVIACSGFHGTSDDPQFEQAVSDFVALCEVASPLKVKVAYEFFDNFATAAELIRKADQRNGGMVIDFFHFWRPQSDIALLERFPVSKVFCVHIDDSIDVPPSQAQDSNRTFPGKGVIPVKRMARSLNRRGYRGPYSLELFGPIAWDACPEEVVKEGLRAVRATAIPR